MCVDRALAALDSEFQPGAAAGVGMGSAEVIDIGTISVACALGMMVWGRVYVHAHCVRMQASDAPSIFFFYMYRLFGSALPGEGRVGTDIRGARKLVGSMQTPHGKSFAKPLLVSCRG